MDIWALPFLALLPILVVVAGLHDLTTMRIPNWISIGLLVGFFPAALVAGLPLDRLMIHLAVGGVALIVGMGLFATRVVGGGDAKLIASAALWMGPTGALVFVVWTGVAGGLFTLMLMMMRARVGVLATQGPNWFYRLMEPKGDIPYGVAIAFGALMTFPTTEMMSRVLLG